MKRIVLFAISFLLVCCNSEDKTITTPATLEVKIDKVGATKVWFSVKSSSPDAAYIYRGVSDFDDIEDYVKFTDSDQVIAARYMESLNEIYEMSNANRIQISSFQDAFCFKGNRSFSMVHIGPDMRHRIIVCQVNPETRSIIGVPVGVEFTSEELPEVQMEFDVQVDGDVLTITPSDLNQKYYWDYESAQFFDEDVLTGMYNYLYDVTDMLEAYGFIDQSVSKGVETFEFSKDNTRMIEGMTYYIGIVPYANHEIVGVPQIWGFEYSKGQ